MKNIVAFYKCLGSNKHILVNFISSFVLKNLVNLSIVFFCQLSQACIFTSIKHVNILLLALPLYNTTCTIRC